MSTGRTFPTGVGAPILLEHIKITRRVRPLQRHPHVSSIAQGSITKTGNGHARRLLIEAAWHHRKPYRVGVELRRR